MRIKITFFFLLFILSNQLMHAQSGCSNVYYYDNDSDGYGTSAVFGNGTSEDFGTGQYLGWSPLTFSFPTPLNNLSSFYYSVTNTAATSDCWFYFYSGGNVVGSLEINPYNGLTFNSNHSFSSPLNGVTSVVIYSNWNPSYLNDLTFYTIPSSITACTQPVGYALNNTDCNDGNSAVNPGIFDVCNTIDDNCDGQVDNGMYYADGDGDGYGRNPGIITQENSTVIITSTGIVLNGSNNLGSYGNGTNIQSQISFVVPTTTTYTFNWSYTTTDFEGPWFDPAYYINNVLVPLSDGEGNVLQSGSVSINVTAGSTFGFAVVSSDGGGGEASLTISDFNGISNLTNGVLACSATAGYVANNDDCNDNLLAVHPGASELCNTIDDDCDGVVDDGVNTFYADTDGDGYGAGVATITCTGPTGYVLNNADCNNNSAAIHPLATEICNNVDDDCDGTADDGVPLITRYLDNDEDGYGNVLSPSSNCFGTFPSNYVVNSTDCNDNLSAVNPIATEVCNEIDDNCDAQIDEGVQGVFYADADGDGFGASVETYSCSLPTGFVTNNGDCNDGNSSVNPYVTEVCNTIDDNCDGQTDEGLNTYYADLDGDGFGAGSAVITCNPSIGFVLSNNDCNDNESTIYPGAVEICNSIDDNCDTQIDEGVLNTYYVDTDGDGYGFDAVTESFAPGSWVLYTPSAFVLVGTPELWIGVSNSIQFVAPTTETYTFNWAYAILDDPDQDPAYYFINDQIVVLSSEWGPLYQSGSVTVTVNAGDVFGFGINSWDDEAGPVWLEITNFNARPYMGIAVGCSQPTGYVVSNDDCNNSNAAVNPGATEICNDIDENCDSEIDEGVQNTYYADADGDGFGGSSEILACTVPAGFSANNLDCNENMAAINPDASEICNGIDENCNGQSDEGVQSIFYYDGDNDGFGTSEVFSGETAQNYGAGQYLGSWGHTVNFPTALNNLVSFNYSITNTAAMSQCVFRFYNGGNLIATVEAYPQNGETINTIYNFSSPLYNVTSAQVFSYWNPAYLNSLTFSSFPSSVSACAQPANYVSNNTDCDDYNANINPGEIDICNTLDEDCDLVADNSLYYVDADDDGYGDDHAEGVLACLASTGYVANNDDCNDTIDSVYPGANEVCNSLDDDCDTQIDEGVQSIYYADTDGDGFGAGTATLACTAPVGFVTTNTDCNNTNGAVNPEATEVCNTIDDDCDTQIDEDVQNNYYADADGDGYGAGTVTLACAAPTGFVATNTDCNDTNEIIYPGATEVCNGIDDNCDTQIDEGVQNSYYADQDGDGFGTGEATLACSAPNGLVGNNTDCDDSVAAVYPGAFESCNNIDDDCDGGVDEFGTTPTAQIVTSCGPYAWNANNTSYNSSGTYYANIPTANMYNTYASFASASSNAGYQLSETEDFSEFWGYSENASGTFGVGFPTWSASATNGFYSTGINGSTALGTNQFATALTFQFSTGVTGVGGNFSITNVFGEVLETTMNVGLSDGTSVALTAGSLDSFTGFTSNGTLIESITINTPWISIANPYVRVDNLVVTTGTPVIPCGADVLQLTVNTPVSYYADLDGDGYGSGTETNACSQPSGFVSNNTDCDDALASVNVGGTEVCNSIDDDCDTQIDEDIFAPLSNVYSCGAYTWNGSTYASSGTYTHLSTSSEGCSITETLVLTIQTGAPSTPTAVTGEVYSCAFLNGGSTTYTTPAVAGNTYEWVAPTGMTILSGQGTNSITVSFGSAFVTSNLKVRAVNGCGSSAYKFFQVKRLAPATPASLTSATGKACPGDAIVFTAATMPGATSYNWTVPVGASVTSGQGTNVATITFNSGFTVAGVVSVKASNGCGVSAAKTKTISRNMPLTPSVITGTRTVTQNQTAVPYSVVNVAGMNYNWTVASNFGSIVTGQGNNAITVNATNNIGSGYTMAVTASNSCGTSPVRAIGNLKIVSGVSALELVETPTSELEKTDIVNLVNMKLYPNPTHGTDVNINLSGVTSENVQIRVLDAMGRQVWSNRYAIDGILNTNITFEQPLANGLYFVEAIFNGEVQTQRLMVQK